MSGRGPSARDLKKSEQPSLHDQRGLEQGVDLNKAWTWTERG